jgi:hypothetical protein
MRPTTHHLHQQRTTARGLAWDLLPARAPQTAVGGALDPDRSAGAVTLEHGLDLALEQTPGLIGQALRGPIVKLLSDEMRRREAKANAVIGEFEAAERS